MENNIINEIKKLKKEIYPRSEWVTLSRDILLKQINPQKEFEATGVGLGDYLQLFTQTFRQRLLEPAVIMLLVLGVFLGSSLTINAAFYSLPGDHLYRVKLALEKAHVALIPDEEKKVELKIEFAQKRVEELDKIVAQQNTNSQEKKKKIELVVKEFKNNVVAVNDQLNKIKQSENNIPAADKEKTLRIAMSVSSKTKDLAASFDEKAGALSAVDKIEVEGIVAEAVQSAQEISNSAQQLVDDVNQEAVKDEEASQGVIEGAAVEPTEESQGTTVDVETTEDLDPAQTPQEGTSQDGVETPPDNISPETTP